MATSATARLQPVDDTADTAQGAVRDDVLIHVRYQPDGEIFSIGETPAALNARQWLKHLLDTASPHYQTLAGGRGFFRIPRETFAALTRQLPA
jgi:hypothetical protein